MRARENVHGSCYVGRVESPRRPEIVYPAPWTYTLVGADAATLFAAIERVLGALAHEKKLSRMSSKGNYCSVELFVTVRDEEQRLELYHALHRDPDVKYVL